MKIAIVGAGNAGCAHACKFKENDHEIRLLKTSHSLHDENFEQLLKTKTLQCIDNTQNGKKSSYVLDLVTRDPKLAIGGADVVFVVVQTLYHESVAKLIGPYLEEGQLVLVVPGYMGTLFFRKYCNVDSIIWAEGESTPFDARLVDNCVINILFQNVRNALAFMPAKLADEGLEQANKLANCYKYSRKTILESALHNPNLIVHTVGAIMSAGRIEYSKGEFWMYREAFTPSIWHLVEQLDKEKMDVLEAFGSDRLPYLEACKFRNEEDTSQDALTVFQHYANCGGPKGPSVVRTRFIYEDVPNGLGLLISLGQKVGVETPAAESLTNIASFLLQENYKQTARTLESFGIDHLARAEIVELLTEGKTCSGTN